MRMSRQPAAIGLLAVALFFVFVTFLLIIAIANGWSAGIGGLFGPLVAYFISLSRRDSNGIANRPSRPITRQTTSTPRRRPDQDPLWDRWLDG